MDNKENNYKDGFLVSESIVDKVDLKNSIPITTPTFDYLNIKIVGKKFFYPPAPNPKDLIGGESYNDYQLKKMYYDRAIANREYLKSELFTFIGTLIKLTVITVKQFEIEYILDFAQMKSFVSGITAIEYSQIDIMSGNEELKSFNSFSDIGLPSIKQMKSGEPIYVISQKFTVG